MTLDVTFILPTLNRKTWLARAIDSCLASENESVKPRVIVIDSQSDDGTNELLQEKYGQDPRVTVLNNDRNDGFMMTCFLGLLHVKTNYATFMYDDDVLSPHYGDFLEEMGRRQLPFMMGYGAQYDVRGRYPFHAPGVFCEYPSSAVLSCYLGDLRALPYYELPVNPICCVLKTELLRGWAEEVRRFCSANPFRSYYMLRRNIGPDLMIYLMALLQDSNGNVTVANTVVGQFSAHPQSMTVRARPFEIKAGYWLAKIWALERIARNRDADRGLLVQGTGYAVSYGIYLILLQLKGFRGNWLISVLKEIAGIFGIAVSARCGFRTIRSVFSVSISTKEKSAFQALPN